MAEQDRTSQPYESNKHTHPHSHPEPVPHLLAAWDGHGPGVSHPHVHSRGAGRRYDHHDGLDGHDSATDPPSPLKLDAPTADDSSS